MFDFTFFRNGIDFMRLKNTHFSSGLWHYVKQYTNQNHAVVRPRGNVYFFLPWTLPRVCSRVDRFFGFYGSSMY